MVDDTLPHENQPAITPPELLGSAAPSDDTPQVSVIRTRVIPAIAGLMMAAIVGLILWSMFAPESARPQTNSRVGGAIVLDDPEPVDEFALEPLGGGEKVALSDLRGKTVVINFWSTWCQPCIREIPILMQASREFDENTVMVGINTLDEKDDAIALMEEFGINYLVLNDNDRREGAVAVEFGVVGVPETYIINPDGELVAYRRGDFESTQDIHTLVALAR
jgi:cytochrome c biogenesis protein CcmG/thiol:disulfide interchange protein DsbE